MSHVNVVQFLGMCLVEGSLGIVLEYVEEGNMRDYITTRPDDFEISNLMEM